jgi:hypothetical protein
MVSQHFFLPVTILLFLVIFLDFAVVIFFQTNRIKNLLKSQHPDLWENLGCPQIRFLPVSRDLPFNQFIMKKQYQEIEDVTLKKSMSQKQTIHPVLFIAHCDLRHFILVRLPLIFLFRDLTESYNL